MDEKSADLANIRATLCAVEAAVAALYASHGDQRTLRRFLEIAAQYAGDHPGLQVEPDRTFFQQSLERIQRAIHDAPKPKRRKPT